MNPTIRQSVCTQCYELNPPYESACQKCGHPLQVPEPITLPTVMPTAVPPPRPAPPPASDLIPLLWTLICLFVALWGLVVSGILRGLFSFLIHPALLIGATGLAAILSGIYLTERMSKERPAPALLSSRDVMALSWTFAALLGAGQLLRFVLPPLPFITGYQPLPGKETGCRVEVWVSGREGDELWGLTELNKRGEKQTTGVIVRNRNGGSARLPATRTTSQGECAIVKYHLMVNGKESDNYEVRENSP